jgi:hypothetical protein
MKLKNSLIASLFAISSSSVLSSTTVESLTKCMIGYTNTGDVAVAQRFMMRLMLSHPMVDDLGSIKDDDKKLLDKEYSIILNRLVIKNCGVYYSALNKKDKNKELTEAIGKWGAVILAQNFNHENGRKILNDVIKMSKI